MHASIVVSPMDLKRPKGLKDFYNERNRWIIRSGIWDTQAQINYINGILSTDVQLKQGLNDMMGQNLFLIAVLALFCFMIYMSYNFLLK